MKLLRWAGAFLLCCAVASAASEPDWPSIEQHAVDLLQRYVRIASVNPPADTHGTAKLLESEFAAAGMQAKLYESGPGGKTNLIVRLPGRDKTKRPLLLLNHMDVVPVDPARWKANPFGAEIRDGFMWGRGTLDMKSTGIMELTALILMKQLGITPSRDIIFLATCDEETGGVSGAAWMIKHHWDELNPDYVLDEGGVGSRDVYTTGKTVFGVSVADKQVLWLKVRATGTSGHASQPIADNANDILISAIEKAKQLQPSTKPNSVVGEMRRGVGTFASNKFMNAIEQNTVSLTTFRSGVGDPPKVNVIPSVAEATLDCRLLPGENAEEFLSGIKARVNNSHVTFEVVSQKADDPTPSRTDRPLYSAIQKAILRQHPDATVMPIIVPFGTDGAKFRVRGSITYGITPMLIDAATLATMHSDSERIPVDQFRQGLHIYFDVLRSDW
jgi:acetylornithine deacetylase/succinyl-diaminopimelate desuccinylase-like protein